MSYVNPEILAAIHVVDNDPKYRESLRASLAEIRATIAKHGRERALETHFEAHIIMAKASRNPIMEAGLTLMMFQYAEAMPLIEEYAQAVSENTLQLSRGELEAASVSAQRARALSARLQLLTEQ